jgi:hypothetical protein
VLGLDDALPPEVLPEIASLPGIHSARSAKI